MAVVDTEMTLRRQRESARRLRFEPSAIIPATDVQTAIEQVVGIAQPGAKAITSAASPYTVLSSDRILLVDTTGGPVTINMQPSAARQYDLEIKDDKGTAATNNISVVPSGAETIDGLAPYTMDSNYSNVVFGLQAGGYYVKN